MKKNILFALLLSFSFLFITKNVSALEVSGEIYENINGVVMTEKQIENLRSLRFTDEQIAKMNQDEFDMNKDLTGELIKTDTKYYKTSYIPNPIVNYSITSESKCIPVNEEVTEEEYNNSTINPASNCGTGDSCWQTEYKKLETAIIKVGNQYRFRSDISWSKPPANRSNDILAMAYNDTNISPIADSKYARYDWHMTRYDNELGWYDDFGSTTFNSGSSKWRIGQGGYSVIIDLKNDEISSDGEHIDQVWNQSAYMYFNVQKSTNVTLYALDVYGSYQHAQATISLSSLANIILNPSAYNIINFVDEGISKKYDNMRKTHAQLSGIVW